MLVPNVHTGFEKYIIITHQLLFKYLYFYTQLNNLQLTTSQLTTHNS
jgi:hypothetical protein